MSNKTQNKPSYSANRKTGKKQTPSTDSLLESLRTIGRGAGDSVKEDLFKGIPEDFFSQMFGAEKPKPKASGDIMPGETLEIAQALEEQKEENTILRQKLVQEQSLRAQLEVAQEKKSQVLKLELQSVVQEVSALAQTTSQLAQETKIAAIQAPVNPGVYHVIFFQKLRETIRSFRKRIEGAAVWLQSSNQRAQKKRGFWGQVGKSGAKRLLSQEDYMQRSAG